MINVIQHSINQSCIKLYKKGYEISIALDNPCTTKVPIPISKGYIIVYKDYTDVTKDFYPDYRKDTPIPMNWDTLKNFMDKIELKLKS